LYVLSGDQTNESYNAAMREDKVAPSFWCLV
jgi:hypothetical protein